MVLAYSCTLCPWSGTEPRQGVDGVTRCLDCGALAEPFSGATIDDGGPAFPRAGHYDADGPADADCKAQDGISLRDYIAVHAMQVTAIAGGPWQVIAGNAYALADAMLAERQKARR